jgi:prophage maintenance system killer protein
MTWRFPTVDQIRQLQARLIDTYGGSHGLRDAGLLESAVARAEFTAWVERSVKPL